MGNKNKKSRRMWSGIKPGDEDFTTIPANIGLTEEQLKWEELSFWQRAQKSEYFNREGKERWLRDCLLLKTEEDFRIAYEIGPPDLYTNEAFHKFGIRRHPATLKSLAEMHPDMELPTPQQNWPPDEPLEPMFGIVMLKDLCLEEMFFYMQRGAYFYPNTPSDEINEMVQQFKQKQKCQDGVDAMSEKQSTQEFNTASKNDAKAGGGEQSSTELAPLPTPSNFGGILRHNSAKGHNKTVRWAHLLVDSDETPATKADDDPWMAESVRLATEAPLVDEWEDDF